MGTELAVKIQYAKAMADSTLLPQQYRKQPANLLFALEYADALGIAPIHAITSIHVIEGKPSASADLIAAMVRKAGHRLRVTGDDTAAVAVLTRSDDPDFEFRAEWTISKAKQANLAGKDVWKKYPAAMLRSRAITEVARMGAPDALYGVIYTPEELGANVDADGEVVDADPAPAPAPEPKPRRTMQRAKAPAPDLPPVVHDAPKDDVVDAEIIPEGISPEQLELLTEALTQAGHATGPEKLHALSEFFGHPVTNPRELSYDDATVILDFLIGTPEPTNEPAYPESWGTPPQEEN